MDRLTAHRQVQTTGQPVALPPEVNGVVTVVFPNAERNFVDQAHADQVIADWQKAQASHPTQRLVP